MYILRIHIEQYIGRFSVLYGRVSTLLLAY